MHPMSLRMVAALRTAIPALSSFSSRLLCPKNLCLVQGPRFLVAARRPMASSNPTPAGFSTSPIDSSSSSSSMEKQFEGFRGAVGGIGIRQGPDSGGGHGDGVSDPTHPRQLASRPSVSSGSRSILGFRVLEKARVQIGVLKGLFGRLAEILKECPGQYYRYHGDWRSETQAAVSLIGFLHWLEKGNLLVHSEAEEKLGLDSSEFGLDVEDYLIGICFMSNELPRYVVNQVTAGDYDCPSKVLKFLTDLHASFRMLNLRNDFLRKKFDGIKYDLRRVEEVYYDVKIRGLTSKVSAQEETTQS